MTTPAIQSSDGHHLGFCPVYFWTDALGTESVHHGRIFRTHEEAAASVKGAKPATWKSWHFQIDRCSTFFETGPVVRSRQTIRELLAAAGVRKAA